MFMLTPTNTKERMHPLMQPTFQTALGQCIRDMLAHDMFGRTRRQLLLKHSA